MTDHIQSLGNPQMENSQTLTIEQDHKSNSCPLCNIPDQEVLAEFPRWRPARTKTMKRHRERLMLYHKEHVKTLDEQSIGEAYMLLLTIGRKYFPMQTSGLSSNQSTPQSRNTGTESRRTLVRMLRTMNRF